MNYDEISHYTESRDNRENIEPETVRQWVEQSFNRIEEELRKIHALSFLEAQLHCDNYHKVKEQFPRMSLDYGFISPYVRQKSGTNELTFSRRYLKERGTEGHNYYPIQKVRGNFNRQAFRRYSSHDEELDLAVMTEEHFRRLRKQSNEMKAILRQIKRQETRKLPRTGDKEVNEE